MLLLRELQKLGPTARSEPLQSYFKEKDFRDLFVLLYRLMVVVVAVNQKNLALSAASSSWSLRPPGFRYR